MCGELYLIKIDEIKTYCGKHSLDDLSNSFWHKLNDVIIKERFFIILMIVFNFVPYMYLFCLYSQFLNGIGGLFKPFADIVLLSLLVNILPRRFYFRQIVKTVILSLSCIFSLVELFIIGKYYTFTTAGIVSVIIGTNPHEAIEFICMYFSWQYLILLIFLAICIYLLKIFQNRIKLPDFVKLIVPFFFLYSFFYTIVPNKNITECMTFTRLVAPVSQAIEDLIAFKDIYDNMNDDVAITENKSDIPNVVFILGESTTRKHMSLYGYHLKTTPKLDEMKKKGEIYVFDDVISSHAYTIGSLREVFTFHNYESNAKWYETSNLFDILNRAGYKTHWLSNQETSGEWANVALAYANRCSYKEFTAVRQSYEQSYRADGEILPLLYKAMANDNSKNFYLLHLMGTHGEYKNRYTADFEVFKASDEHKNSAQENMLTAQYDNAILYNDTIIVQIIEAFKDKNAIVIYMPDHGEEIYDVKNIKGHSDDNATSSMLEIPFIIYTSQQFKEKYPQLDNRIKNAVHRPFMTDDIIHLMLDILNIKTVEYQETRSLISPYYNQDRKRMFLGKDYDEEMKQ